MAHLFRLDVAHLSIRQRERWQGLRVFVQAEKATEDRGGGREGGGWGGEDRRRRKQGGSDTHLLNGGQPNTLTAIVRRFFL